MGNIFQANENVFIACFSGSRCHDLLICLPILVESKLISGLSNLLTIFLNSSRLSCYIWCNSSLSISGKCAAEIHIFWVMQKSYILLPAAGDDFEKVFLQDPGFLLPVLLIQLMPLHITLTSATRYLRNMWRIPKSMALSLCYL